MSNIFAELKKGNVEDENYFTRAFALLLEEIPELIYHLVEEFFGDSFALGDDIEIELFEWLGDAGKIDMAIKSSTANIFIENKKESPLSGKNQLVDYNNYIRKHYPDSKFVFISKSYINDGSVDLTDKSLLWSKVFTTIERFRDDYHLDKKERYLIEQFLEFMRGEGMSDEKVSWEITNGLKSLQVLLNMMREVLEEQKKERRIKKITPGTGGSWAGYNVGIFSEGTDFFLVLNYNEPNKITFDSDDYELEDDNFLDFQETRFLALTKDEQKEELKKFVKKSLDEFHEKFGSS